MIHFITGLILVLFGYMGFVNLLDRIQNDYTPNKELVLGLIIMTIVHVVVHLIV